MRIIITGNCCLPQLQAVAAPTPPPPPHITCSSHLLTRSLSLVLLLLSHQLLLQGRDALFLGGTQAQVKRGRPVAAEYLLDVLGEKPPLSLPTQDRSGTAPGGTQVPLSRARSCSCICSCACSWALFCPYSFSLPLLSSRPCSAKSCCSCSYSMHEASSYLEPDLKCFNVGVCRGCAHLTCLAT